MKKIICLSTIAIFSISAVRAAEWTPYTIFNSPLETDYISSLEVSPAGQVFIGSQGEGLYVKSGDDWRNYNHANSGVPIDYTFSMAFTPNAVLLGSASGNLDTQPVGEGLSVLNPADSTWSQANHGLGISPIITGIEITPNYRAVSTYGGGITLYNNDGWIRYQNEFRTEFTYADSQQQTFIVNPGTYIPTDYIKRLEYDSQNNVLWIATLNGGAVAFSGGQWQTYNMSNTGLPSNRIQLIKADPGRSAVYFGTFGFGLARKIGDEWTVYNTANSPLVANYIHSLEIRPDNGDLWVGTNYAINVITPEDEWQAIIPPDSNLVWGEFYSDIAFDSSGNVWVSTYGGGIASMALPVEDTEPDDDSLFVDMKKLKFLLRSPRRHDIVWLRANLEPTVELEPEDSVSISVNSDQGPVYAWNHIFDDFYHIFRRRNTDVYCTYIDGSTVVLKYFHNRDEIRLYLLDWQPEIDRENIVYELDVRIKLGGYVGHDIVYIGEGNPLGDPDADTMDVAPTDILFSTEYDPIIAGIDDEISDLPNTIAIPVNYPNPFNAYTTISFGISQPGQVKLTVYDLLGRIITVDEHFLNIGDHDISWSGNTRASGVYYYTIQTESGIQTGRMTLLK